MTVYLTGDAEIRTLYSRLDFRTFHQHELASDVLLIVNGRLTARLSDYLLFHIDYVFRLLRKTLQFEVSETKDQRIAVTINPTLQEGAIGCASVGHHKGGDAFLATTH